MFSCFIRPQGKIMEKTDKNTYIIDLKARANEFVTARDWHQFHTPKEMALNLSVEASELLELFIFKNNAEIAELLEKDEKFKAAVADELGDIIMSTMLFALQAKLDIATSFYEKVRKTELKYPVEKAKGKNKKYTEY
jgi:NTP pyrophosphatase (non-canonical NTP hydrolase)